MNQLVNQACNVVPPRNSNGIVFTVSTVATAYDLRALSWGGVAYDAQANTKGVYLTLYNDSANAIYVVFQEISTVTLDNTAAIAVGGTPALQTTYCATIPAATAMEVRIEPVLDRYIVLKSASGATNLLRVHASSDPSA